MVSVIHVKPPSKYVKAEASYVCVCNGRAESPVGRYHGRIISLEIDSCKY